MGILRVAHEKWLTGSFAAPHGRGDEVWARLAVTEQNKLGVNLPTPTRVGLWLACLRISVMFFFSCRSETKSIQFLPGDHGGGGGSDSGGDGGGRAEPSKRTALAGFVGRLRPPCRRRPVAASLSPPCLVISIDVCLFLPYLRPQHFMNCW